MSFFRGSLAVLALVLCCLTVAAQESDLSVSKTGPDSAAPGANVTFNINVTNGGPDDAGTATLTDVIPAGLTFSSLNKTSTAFTCSTPAVGFGGTITCTATPFPAGSSVDFTVVLTVPVETSPGTTFTNVATVSSTTFDPNDENNSSATSFTTSGGTSADLLATKSGPSNAVPNSDVQFNIVISNSGPDAAQSVSFTDPLPGNMTFVSMAQNSGPAFDCSSAPAPGSSGTVTCTLATMNAGASASFTLTTHIPSGPSGVEYPNLVTVTSTTPDPTPENNQGIATVTTSSADLSIKKVGPATATAGGTISWTLTAANGGPDTASDVSFVDQLPSGTTFVSLAQNNGPAPINCSTPTPGQNGQVNCGFTSLASGDSAQFTLTANVAASIPNGSMISNTATIALSGNADPNTANNSQTATTTINTSADVGVTKTDSSDPVTAGNNLTYTITVNNAGPSNAASVSLSDTLPAGTTFVSLSSPGGWSCTVPAVGAGGTVSCSNPSLGLVNAVFTLTVAVAPSVTGGTVLSNTATASSATTDPNSGNESGTATTTVVAVQPTISISDVSKAEGNSGTTSYTFNVTLSAATTATVKVDYATADGTATAPSDYIALPTTTLTFNPGDLTKPVTVLVNGDTSNEPDETFTVNLTNPQNGTIADNQGLGTILNDDTPVIQFSSATYTIGEGDVNTPEGYPSLTVQVNRTGDTSGAATVHYATSDLSGNNECDVANTGNASQRCDYLMLSGTLRFAAGDGSKTFQIPIVNDGYVEGAEQFTIDLTNVTGVATTLGPANLATVTITDNDTTATDSAHNPYLSNDFFVRMHYVDFLEREPDTTGFGDWVSVLNGCGSQHGFLGAPANCDRAHISKGFFGATEFIDRGFLIYRLFDVGLGRLPDYATEYNPDSAQLRGFGLTPAQIQGNLDNYLTELAARPEFATRYASVSGNNTTDATALIQMLENTATVTLSASPAVVAGNMPPQYGRADLINRRATNQFSVVQTVKAFVEQKVVYDKEFPGGFVTMQYFAYLHRNPDMAGRADWLDVLLNGKPSQGIAPGDYNHLIFGFIYSTEYRKRFGQP